MRSELQRLRTNQQNAWVETQISHYSQQLLQQLNTEKEKNKSLTIRIRKYSKNVKSLHKKTSSLSGLSKYAKQHRLGKHIPLMAAKSSPIDQSTPTTNGNIELEIVEDETKS